MASIADRWHRLRPQLGTLIRYGLVGAAQNGLAYAALLGLIFLGLKAWQATAILYPVAATVSYVAHRTISFRADAAPRQRLRYGVVYVAMYGAAVGLNWAQERAGVPSWAAALVTMVVSAVAMFALLRWWVFPQPNSPR